jgi:hypothetical protein
MLTRNGRLLDYKQQAAPASGQRSSNFRILCVFVVFNKNMTPESVILIPFPYVPNDRRIRH